MVTIGVVCNKVNKINPKDNPDAEFDYIDISGIDNEQFRVAETKRYTGQTAPSRARQLVRSGDVVFSTVRTYLKNFARVTPELDGQVASTGFCVLRTATPELSKYLFYYVQFDPFLNELAKFQRGTSYPAVRDGDVFAQFIPMPPSGQAERIVAEIEKQFSRLDEAIASLKRAKANLKRYKAAVLKAAVEGKLTAEWRKANPDVEPADKLLKRILEERRRNWTGKGKYKEPAAPDTSNLPELPKGWVWVVLGQVIDEPNYGTSKKCDYGSGAIGVLRIPNIANGFIDAEDLKSADFDDKEKRTYALKAGDILTIRSNGSVSLVGQCALVRDIDTQFFYAGYLIRMRPASDGIKSEYLMTCFSSQLLRRQIEAKAKSTSGVNNFNSGELQSLVCPFCCTDEQQQIVTEVEHRLSIITSAEAHIDANLRRADRLRQSILKQAFSGQLVPAISYEEPAGVLLDRVGPMQLVAPKAAIGGGRGSASALRETKTAATALGDFTSLDSILAAILNYMQTSREYSRAEIADALGLSTGRWNAAIQELKRRGKVRQIGERRGSRYRLI